MSTYVMSDIHGCYGSFLVMLDKIGFSGADLLVMAGDYIDRGRQSYEMLRWIERCPANVRLLRGNHDEEFALYVSLMLRLGRQEGLGCGPASNGDALSLYDAAVRSSQNGTLPIPWFDHYGTVGSLVYASRATMGDLCRWAEIIRQMPYFYEWKGGDKVCVAVHAGYAEELEEVGRRFNRLEDFYLYAREESCRLGGKRHGVVIAGHTPTIVKGRFSYNEGNVFRYYDREKDCTFYDIDCGCVFRGRVPGAKLACIRLEDEEIFYV